MSNYDDRDTAITRDPAQQGHGYYQPMPPQQYYGYGQQPMSAASAVTGFRTVAAAGPRRSRSS